VILMTRRRYEELIEGYATLHGPAHATTLAVKERWAILVGDAQGGHGAALARPVYEEVCSGYRKAHGPTHPRTLSLRMRLAQLVHGQGKLVEAQEVRGVSAPAHPNPASAGVPCPRALGCV
jgi:hypothetical protein